MKLTLVLKGSLNSLPPILSLCYHLLDMNHRLTIICDTITTQTKNELNNREVQIVLLKHPPQRLGTIDKIFRWVCFHKKAWTAIKENPADLYWICSADTALALGHELFSLPFILHLHELYDTVPFYRNRLGEYMIYAKKAFVPEEVRAHIFRAWYHLKETPVVLPNKPYGHPRKRNLPITDPEAAKAFAKIPQGSKILFYQGGVSARRNIKPIAKAIEELGAPWALAIQCPIVDNDYYKDLVANYKFYYIPYVAAPKHLEITSNVHFGIVTYTHLQMNNEFCAPNKIWEYSGFGLPLFGNDAYGLLNTVGKYHAGVFPNMDGMEVEDIKRVLDDLLKNEEEYSRNASIFFDSIDNEAIITNALSHLD